ncbi:cobyrinate a,c-diamide synthase [Pseudomonas sp. ABC1]|nr:cobyrinate a,c-diamide synthase [Pseudomonas sp. ABC1]
MLIAAPSSGQGKTTVTAALARAYRNSGLRVRVFKCGPDFLDPTILAHASGQPVYQLDLWMVGEEGCRQLLWQAAQEADLILVEGVMGLFDGKPCAADLARCFGIAVMAVIDASGMAQTFAAMAHGLATFQPGLPFSGVLANRVGSAGHARLLRDSLPENIHWYGALSREQGIELPSRHLGLLQAAELGDLDVRLERAAQALGESAELPLPPSVEFVRSEPDRCGTPLAGVRIGVARDLCFAFIYQANLDLLRELGAELVFFSPLADDGLPEIDSLYLPGGYPELSLQRLHENRGMAEAIQAHHQAGKPILAECGGMLYLLDGLVDLDGERRSLLGLLPGEARMQKRLAALALQSVDLPEGQLRGHTFHHSALNSPLEPLARGECPNGRGTCEPVYRLGRLTASYIHFYLPSNPVAAAELLRP